MIRIPSPSTFAEGQRAIALWLMASAGIFCGIGTIMVILLFWLGGWSSASEHQRLLYIVLIAITYPLGCISVILALAVGGPVGRFKMDANRGGVGFDLSGDQPAATVTTTTAVTTPAAKDGQ